MTDNNAERPTIDTLRYMASCAKQIILLDALEQVIQAAKVRAMADYASAQTQTAKDRSLHLKLDPILLSKVALLAELEGASCDEQ